MPRSSTYAFHHLLLATLKAERDHVPADRSTERPGRALLIPHTILNAHMWNTNNHSYLLDRLPACKEFAVGGER